MPAFSLRPKTPQVAAAPQAEGSSEGCGSAYAHAAVERGFHGVLPARSTPPVPDGRRFSLRGPVKPPAPNVKDDEDDLGNLTSRSSGNKSSGCSSLTMAGAAAVSLRKSLRQNTSGGASSASTPAPSVEEITPRPPSAGKPSRPASRPTPQAPRISNTSQGDERASFTNGPQTPTSSSSGGGGKELVAPTGPLVDEDEWRVSNFSFGSSRSSRYHRAKSTPSRGRHQRPNGSQTSRNSGEEYGPAGVIQSGQSTRTALQGGRLQRMLARQDSGSHTEERESYQSRQTGTFTSRNSSRTGTYNSRYTEESGRGTFNFGDGDGEGMLNDTIGDY